MSTLIVRYVDGELKGMVRKSKLDATPKILIDRTFRVHIFTKMRNKIR